MKRLLACFLILSLLLPLAACGEKAESPVVPVQPAAPAEPASAAEEVPEQSVELISLDDLEPTAAPVEDAAPAPVQSKTDFSETTFRKMSAEQKAATTVDIYLLAGEANAAGYSKWSGAPDGTLDLNKYPYVQYSCLRRYIDQSIKTYFSFEPIHKGLGSSTDYIGPELGMGAFLNALYEQTSNRRAVIVKVASAGTSLLRHNSSDAGYSADSTARFNERGSWYPAAAEELDASGNPVSGTDYWRSTGFLDRELKSSITKVYEDLTKLGFPEENIRFCSLCWMQGEEDLNYANEYPAVFSVFVDGIRSCLSEKTGKDYSALPVIVGEISETFSSASSLERNRKFIAMQDTLPTLIPGVTVIPTAGFEMNAANAVLGSDRYYWNYADMVEIGRMFADAAYTASHN